jgi:hypothetical protein
VVGFTWYSLLHQVDWDSALRDDAGHINQLGLFDLDRNMMPVGKAYSCVILLSLRAGLPALVLIGSGALG